MPHAPGFHGARDKTIKLIGPPLVLPAAKNWRQEASPKINLRPRAYRRPQNFVRAGVDFEQQSQSSLISLVWHVVLGPKQVPIQPRSGPEDIANISAAFEAALRELGSVDRAAARLGAAATIKVKRPQEPLTDPTVF